jgi:hypothetical protein
LLYIRACSDQHFLELQVRYGFRVMANPGEWTEIGVAGAISMGALMSRPALRPSMPQNDVHCAIETQTEIGWLHMFRGFVSIDWGHVNMESDLVPNPSKKMHVRLDQV